MPINFCQLITIIWSFVSNFDEDFIILPLLDAEAVSRVSKHFINRAVLVVGRVGERNVVGVQALEGEAGDEELISVGWLAGWLQNALALHASGQALIFRLSVFLKKVGDEDGNGHGSAFVSRRTIKWRAYLIWNKPCSRLENHPWQTPVPVSDGRRDFFLRTVCAIVPGHFF